MEANDLVEMIVTVAFDVRNYVEVMEGWPIKIGDTTFLLERDENVLKRVCLAYSNVSVDLAPKITPANKDSENASIKINGGGYAALARKSIMNWQAVLSGQQIVDLDYDNYEIRFHAENVAEDHQIHIKSFKPNPDKALNAASDFEQIGRAFCVGSVSEDRIESTSHYREGRLAFEAGRFVDAYNNMFLFLETRYCDGKTGNEKQTDLLSKSQVFCKALEKVEVEFSKPTKPAGTEKFELFGQANDTREKIRELVLLRGKLRHHSLKSPHRWDPNKQDEHKAAARFISAVVLDIVLKESLADIYAPETLQKYRDISVSTGSETKVKLTTNRLERKPSLALDMSYPTTVISSQLCLVTVRHAMEACDKDGQLSDTTRFHAEHGITELELLSLELDVWAYTKSRKIEMDKPIETIRCCFEHISQGIVVRHDFSVPFESTVFTITDAWNFLRFCFDHIEQRDPTTRILSLKLLLKESTKAILSYRVGNAVKN